MTSIEPAGRRATPKRGTNGFKPLPRQTLSGQIAEEIRTAILEHKFSLGAQLNEQELAEQFRVSRGPVREALQRLIQEGLVVSAPHRGVFVTELNSSDLADIYLARETLEGAAIRIVMQSERLFEVRRLLTRITEDMGEAAKRDDWLAITELDLRFHRELVAASQSPRLIRMYTTVQAETKLCLHMLIGGYRGSDAFIEEHRRLVALLGGDDVDQVLDELPRHFGDPSKNLNTANRRRDRRKKNKAA